MLDRFEQDLRERLKVRWFCPAPVGLEMDEVAVATAFWPHTLPIVYQRFLLVCGRDAGDLFFEYNWKAADLERMNDRLLSYAKAGTVTLPAGVFTFLDYIGDYFWCFCAGELDPEVQMFDHFEFVDTNYKLSEFLLRWEQFETPRG